jgi:hypothetical protein
LIAKADEIKLDFIPVVCTQGTLMISEHMLSYFLTAYDDINQDENREPLELWREISNDFADFISCVFTHIKKAAPGSEKCPMSLSFEAVCSNRTTYTGEVHTELTVSYKLAHFDLLGVTVDIGTDDERYLPHFDIEFDILPVEQPLWRKVSHTDHVFQMMADIDLVVKGNMKRRDFTSKYFENLDDGEIDFEGFVLLAPKLDGSYDYSKIKTTLYYYAHKVRESNIPALLALPDAVNQHYPTVSKLKTFYGTIETKVPELIQEVHTMLETEIKLGEESKFFDGLPEKAKVKFAKFKPDVVKRMYINACSSVFTPISLEILAKYYNVDPEKEPANWLRKLVMNSQPFGKKSVAQLIESKDRLVTDLYLLLLE